MGAVRPVGRNLRETLESFQNTQGIERLMDYIFYQVAAVNGFDAVGHYLRAGLMVNQCATYAIRPVGGWMADRYGGARVTVWTFLGMAASTVLVLWASSLRSLPAYIVGFLALFVLSGIGNGSTYKMIPAIFAARAVAAIADGTDPEQAATDARRRSRALIGIAGAVGAFGGVLVNLALRQAFITRGTGTTAYLAFGLFYVICMSVTWACYRRRTPTTLVGV